MKKAREGEQEKMRNRREQIDLLDGGKTDMYGNKQKGFQAMEDDMFGDGMEDLMKAEATYQRMDNGMGLNANTDEIKK